MKSFRKTKTKEALAEQRVKEESALPAIQEFFNMLVIATDYIEILWATSSTDVLLKAPTATSFCPTSPSACININQVDL